MGQWNWKLLTRRFFSSNRAAVVMATHQYVTRVTRLRLAILTFLLAKLRTGHSFYISGSQFEYWSHTELLIDVVKGRGSGFSLEALEGICFLTRSVVFTDDQMSELEALGERKRGLQDSI